MDAMMKFPELNRELATRTYGGMIGTFTIDEAEGKRLDCQLWRNINQRPARSDTINLPLSLKLQTTTTRKFREPLLSESTVFLPAGY